MYTNIDHVVIVVKDLDRAIKVFRDQMGMTLKEVRDIPRSKVKVAFFPIGHGNLEVIQPMDPNTSPAKHLAEHGEGIYQVSLAVDNLDNALAALRKNGVAVPREDINPPAGAGRRRAYPATAATMGACFQLIEGPNRYAAKA